MKIKLKLEYTVRSEEEVDLPIKRFEDIHFYSVKEGILNYTTATGKEGSVCLKQPAGKLDVTRPSYVMLQDPESGVTRTRGNNQTIENKTNK